jgi:deoxyribonuclease V
MGGRYLDFYTELQRILDQVPSGSHTTVLELARAMGDLASAKAIRESLLRPNFWKYVTKVNGGNHSFTSFQTDEPLLRLAEKQNEMAKLVVEEDVLGAWGRVAGVDAAYEGDHTYAACVVVDRSGRVVSEGSAEVEVSFPYIPGYFYYREGPALVAAVRGIDFDVLMVNAHGVAHPRRLGLASQLGLGLDKSTVGVSTGLLVGEVRRRSEVVSDIYLRGSRVGVRLDGKPSLIITVGHMVSLGTAVSVVKTFWGGLGLPRPLELAHEAAHRLCSSRS